MTEKKGEHTTGSLLLCWQTNIFSASYRYQPISSRRNSAFVVIFIISFSIGSGSGLDIIKYQHSSKPWPLTKVLMAPLNGGRNFFGEMLKNKRRKPHLHLFQKGIKNFRNNSHSRVRVFR
jgi:hypothetical protein